MPDTGTVTTCAQATPQDYSVLTSCGRLQERRQQALLEERVHQAANQWSFDVA